MRNPKVSVIVTTYNRCHLIGKAIDSVLKQSFRDFEIIVVDDGSLDNTETAVKNISTDKIVYIRNKENLGGAKSLNIGLRTAKGEYICPLDDDDEWIDSDKLKKQYEFLERNANHAVVGTQAEVLMKDGEKIKRLATSLPLSDSTIRDKMLFTNQVPHVSSMYRKLTAVMVGGYDVNLPRAKDWDLFLKIGLMGLLANLSDVCVRFGVSRKEKK